MGSALVGMGRESMPSQGKLVSVPRVPPPAKKKVWHVANLLKLLSVARVARGHVP